MINKNANSELPIKFISKSFLIWFICSIAFITSLLIDTDNFNKNYEDTAFGKSDIYGYILGSSMLFGSIAFIVALHYLNKGLMNLFKIPKLPGIVKYFIFLPLLPLLLLIYILRIFKIQRNFFKILRPTLFLIAISPIWAFGYLTIGIVSANQLGYITESIPIGGTGSMYPTFPKGVTKTPEEQGNELVATPGMFRYPNGLVIAGKRLFGHQIERGDIVVVENEVIRKSTEELIGQPTGWVKRVVGLPNDTLEIREGVVYINNEPLEEPYTAKAHSTFGQSFLNDCQKIVVPNNSIFIMGDNRKGSGDSREIGFVNLNDVRYVLPLENQKGILDKNWRNTSKDAEESSKLKLDKTKYLAILNEERVKNKLKPLKYNAKLEQSAGRRGSNIIKFNDFSYEATKSGYTVEQAMNEVGYSNIVWNEGFLQGYYEADELIDGLLEDPEWKKNLLFGKDFQEFGIAEVEGVINNCPTQVVVLHVGGYVPPDYKKEDIEGWKNLLNKLREIQPGWQELKEYEDFYQENRSDVDRINSLISQRLSNLSAIVSRMEANQWLTATEQKYIDQDAALFQEIDSLASKLNSR
ncbi:signal peptidase I [Candidatus Daviesbacteria bacterium RIFCSPHIGHO2_02_FULL_36_13]|uniref:Signal peptidase I n=1 Tax=Candidatus Daviesbacteria bacterium RIFCSPHIGHO2_02_FULL_36_13 TaxID=1797768 RepID=A0A1F5JWQ3_9BACT|nr:MAG: signal peptidase I [Candidatus Daviesbacteria bacterium RIFCSPHIGHO2_02_FULL_36_13]